MKNSAKFFNEINTPAMLTQLGWMALAFGLAILALRPLLFPTATYLWGGDYSTFWAASWLAQHGQIGQLYGTRLLEGIPTLATPAPPWFYPPTMLLLVYPAAQLPFLFSYAVYAGLSLALAAMVWKFWQRDKLHLLLLLGAPATLLNILYGQNGLLITSIWTGGLLLLQTQPFMAGCVLGLLTLKPQMALLAPLVLMASRQWRALYGFMLSAIVLFDLSWFAFGSGLWIEFIQNASAVGQSLRSGTLLDITKIGSLYMASRLSGAGHVEALIMQALMAVSATAICLRLWYRKDVAYDLKAAAALVSVLMITPYQFIYDLPLLLAALAFWHKGSGTRWAGVDRLTAWLLWLSPLLAQALASKLGIGCLPAILVLALWRINVSCRHPSAV